ncbi:hypothetical protein TCON_1228 [Astathelohania contejeani]|uniref:Uncharacterized protein n=1 Tax=Astathelohania contejeani TaxID=164912 RepID=A0ABQ7HZG8_9MICR|nr:hypothetical protein TCON_1228 [Thelohania contejeani]
MLLAIFNIFILLFDSQFKIMISILDSQKSGYFHKLIEVFFEEVPMYFLAIIFNAFETIYSPSLRPYFNLTSLLYLISSLVLLKLPDWETELRKNNSINLTKKLKYKSIILIVTQALCIINEGLLYFLLVTNMAQESYFLFYFSLEFLFRLVYAQIPKKIFFEFIFLKYTLFLLSVLFIAYRDSMGMPIITAIIFVLNGLTNHMVFKSFEKDKEANRFEHLVEIIVFGVVSLGMVVYSRRPERCLKDFIFFCSIRI